MFRIVARTKLKLIPVLTLLTLASIAVGQAQDLKVEVSVASGPKEMPSTTLSADTAKLYILFKTAGVKRGDKFRGVLMADHAGQIAPNSKVNEGLATLDGDTQDGAISFTKPANGWPPGDYHVEIYINEKLEASAKFTFEIPK